VKVHRLAHAFVETVPERMAPGTIYVSLPFATAVHLCACGCGEEVVTSIGPLDWSVEWHGASVSLHPSVGNARLPCRSHYYVRRGRVEWLPAADVPMSTPTAGSGIAATVRRLAGAAARACSAAGRRFLPAGEHGSDR
jgi:hypothetical protein